MVSLRLIGAIFAVCFVCKLVDGSGSQGSRSSTTAATTVTPGGGSSGGGSTGGGSAGGGSAVKTTVAPAVPKVTPDAKADYDKKVQQLVDCLTRVTKTSVKENDGKIRNIIEQLYLKKLRFISDSYSVI
uniref:Uncharacterized protein n=1 Tax=Trichobilharzia regenti TaxID=157069 RepID=A0AA85J4S3_TRIRE|nr:unnamed protein product [Trichobilharzia regenti]